LAIGVAVRRRWPFGAALLAFGAVTVQDALGGRVTHHSVGALLAIFLIFYGAGAFLAERRAWLALSLGAVAIGADALIATTGLAEVVFPAIFLLLLPWAVGRMLRERGARERAHRESAERLDSEREQRAATAAFGERARIARELHDVIAHNVSVMVVQASAGEQVFDEDAERAREFLASVSSTGRAALAELRRLLGVIRAEDDRGGEPAYAPQPGIEYVDDLVRQVRETGLPVDLSVIGEPRPLPEGVGLCAYRIVQEALTNTLKHAHASCAQVNVHYAPDALELRVADDGHGGSEVNGESGGHGLIGMRERVALCGGELKASAQEGRGLRGPGAAPARGADVMSLRVLICDDQALVRGGFRAILTPSPISR
jgi:signal transduction histidine kinase